MNWAKKLQFGVLFAVVLACLSTNYSAMAQVSNAAILGHVEDPSGAGIPGAKVTLTSIETGATRTVPTDNAGSYHVLSLPVGRYEVKAEKDGFGAVTQAGINLVVGQEAVVNLVLKVGSVQQQVTVTSDSSLVNTTTADVSGLVGEKQVKDLPLNGRSYDNLITLNPAAVNFTAERTYGFSGVGNSFTVAGRRQWENLFLLNGIEYTGASIISITPGGVSGEMLGIDATREFNVVSGTYSSEYGKRSGAQVSVVTQSGGNTLHGSAFEFLRNSVLDARNFFDHPTGRRIPPFTRNQFGGALGGPIKKDKTFIFGNYEGFRQRLGLSLLTPVPDENARQGILPDPNNNNTPTPVTGLVPEMLPYLQSFWPAPNGANLGGGLAQTFSNPVQSITEDFGTLRVDHSISEKDSLSGVYTIDSGISSTPLTDPIFKQDLYLRNQVLSLQEVHTFSPHVLNTFTFGLSRAGFTYANTPINAVPADLSFVANDFPGSIAIGGSQTGGNTLTNGVPANPKGYVYRTLFTFQDGVQIVKGAHQISIGGLVQRIRSNERTTSRSLGQATFTNLTSFLQGTVASFTVAPNQIPQAWRQLNGAWYIEDSIRVTPRLNLNLGLRHEMTNGWNEATGRGAIFQTGANGILETLPQLVSQIYPQNDSTKLFSPRVALAWDPFGNGKTSVRAGFGMYYNLVDTSIASGSTNNNPPFNGAATFSNRQLFDIIPFTSGVDLPPSCDVGVPAPCTIYAPRGNQSHLKTPTVESWNLTIEQELTRSMVFRLGYIGSFAYHQLLNEDANAIRPLVCSDPAGCVSGGLNALAPGSTPGSVTEGTLYVPVTTRPNPFLNTGVLTYFNGIGSYNALTADLEKKLTHGLMFRTNYTFSKNLDMGSGVGGSLALNTPQTVTNPYNLRSDYGISPLNVPHQFTGVVTYELPFGAGKAMLGDLRGVGGKLVSGWGVSTIVSAHSGFSLTPVIGANRSGNGDTSVNPDRPSYNPAFTGNLYTGTQKQWFNPNAFILPILGTWGDVPRSSIIGPKMSTVDFSAIKRTTVTERVSVEFRAEFFNILNHVNFGNPSLGIFSGAALNPTAGSILSTSTTSRQIQFGLKVLF